MNALLNALANLARLRWLDAAFCALALVCATANANAIASGTQHEQTKTRVGGFEQNSPLNVCANSLASAETHRGISSAQREAASAFSHAAEGAGIGQETMTLYHGSIDNYSNIMSQGFDAARTPTWVTTSLEAAQNAIGQSRVLSPGQGFDVGIVTSVVPANQFSALQQLGGISDLRMWPGFGGGPDFTEFVLRSPAAIDLFNSGIVR